MRKFLYLILVLIFPFVATGISVRLAFTEWFVEWVYSRPDFPEDRWGLENPERLRLAKLGLRAVLSQEGLEEFKRAKLPDGRKAFRKKEVKHMEDVKRVLEFYFPLVYGLSLFWLLGVFFLRKAQVLIASGLFSISVLGILALLIFLNYERAFEVFHLILFDPHSWRFKYTDTLLRIYPMKFWFDATVFVAVLSFLISFSVLLIGVAWKWKKGRGLIP